MNPLAPLATRMRPLSLNEVVGQSHLIGDGKVLTRMVETGCITSIILYGPPGVGKTSIASALSQDLNLPFRYFNAGVHAKKLLQTIAAEGKPGKPVVVLVDEVHRLDKPKQDFLLMQIEDGSLIMVGATTENPHISISPALRSRSHIFELHAIDSASIQKRLHEALSDKARGLGDQNVKIAGNLIKRIAERSNGDIRKALNVLELVVMSTESDAAGKRAVTPESVDTCLNQRDLEGDKDGDNHYNLLSAFQKSIRGSDADAALHYLARLIQTGDLISIVRRLLVISYEDISLAAPELGAETLAACTVAERVGFPEARIPLAQIVIRLALSPKSNVALRAIQSATDALDSNRPMNVPPDVQDAHYKGAKALGRGVGYKYPHDFPYGITPQQYLPDAFKEDHYLTFRDAEDTPKAQVAYTQINRALKPK